MNALPQSVVAVEASRARAAVPGWARLGFLFGLLSAASIALWGPIGVSSTYPRLVGAALRWLVPGWAGANPYLVKMGALAKPESFLVLGLLIGGFAASRLSRQPAPAPAAIHPGETRSAVALPRRLPRRRPDHLRRPTRRRLHQRAHHLRHHPALA